MIVLNIYSLHFTECSIDEVIFVFYCAIFVCSVSRHDFYVLFSPMSCLYFDSILQSTSKCDRVQFYPISLWYILWLRIL